MTNLSSPLRSWADMVRARIAFDWKALAPDIAIATGFALAGFLLCLHLFFQLSPAIEHFSTWDFWFESDPARVYDLGIDRTSIHHHSTSHHPLFSLFYFPPIFVLTSMFDLSSQTATGVVLACGYAIWLVLANSAMRVVGLRRLDAAAFTLLMGLSAAALFWFPVPETFGFGALSITAVILVAALAEKYGGAPNWVFVVAGAFAMSMTTTNWLAGLALLFVFLPWFKAGLRATETMILVLAAWAVQKVIFPEADNFLNIFRGSEVDYLFNEEALGLVPKLIAFFFHSIVMPDITTAWGYRLTVQPALPGQGGPLAMAGALGWAALAGFGIWSAHCLIRTRGLAQSKTILVLLLSLAGQILVTILFGIESFLYTAHSAPLLVMLAALSALTPARVITVPLALVLALVIGVSNLQKFEAAVDQTQARYQHERNFSDTLTQLTSADELIVCGARALTGSGEAQMHRDPPAIAEPHGVVSNVDPDTCLYAFGAPLPVRNGWRLWYEDWSVASVDTFAARGARYFVTQYQYGLARQQAMFDTLDQRYTRLARSGDWAIYDLQAEKHARGRN